MDRFKDALQTQYDNWVTDSAKATAAGFKNNQNITAVKDAVNKCFDIIYAASGKLDAYPMNVSQAIVKAYAMPHSHVEVDADDLSRFVSFVARIAERLDAERAAIPAAPAPANPNPDAPAFGHSGFMQV